MRSKSNDAEVQRRRMMSQDERNITARDAVAKNLYEHAQRSGQRMSYEQAHKKATEIAHRVLRKDGERGR